MVSRHLGTGADARLGRAPRERPARGYFILDAVLLLVCAFTTPLRPGRALAQTGPELPRVFVDTTYSPPTRGQLIRVKAGGDLQAAFAGNVLAGSTPADYSGHPGNFFPASDAEVGFVDLARGNYRLGPASAYKNAGTDGKDPGAAIDALEAATAGAVSGEWTSARSRRR